MAFTWASFVAETETIEADIKAEAVKFEAALTKALPEIDKVFAAIAAAAPYLGVLDPELLPAVPIIEAAVKAAPTVANNMLIALGSANVSAAISNTAATLLSVGQAAAQVTTGGAAKTTAKAEAVVTNIATNAVNMLIAGQTAAQTAAAGYTASLTPGAVTTGG